MATTRDLGPATAYAYAVEQGYTGTEAEFAQEMASMATKAPLASPAFTGTPTAPTASAGTDSTQIATTAFVKNAVDNIEITVDSALSDSSENPVQNKVINTAVSDLNNQLVSVSNLDNNLLANAVFSTGEISLDTGADVSSDIKLRTSYINLTLVDTFDISVASNYKYLFVLIANNSVIYTQTWTVYSFHIDVKNDYPTAQYLRILQQKLDNTLPDKNYVTCTFNNSLYNKLDNIDANKKELRDNVSLITTLNKNLLAVAKFETGGISFETGEDVTYSNMLRSSYIPLDAVESFDISILSGYKYFFVLIANNSVIYSQTWTVYSFHIDVKNDYPTAQYIRIVQQKMDNTLPDKNYVECVLNNTLLEKTNNISSFTNNNDYFYVKNNKLICNNYPHNSSNVVAKYAKVDVGADTKKILCKFTFKGGTLALISTSLDTDNHIANITKKSIHCTFNASGATVGLFNNHAIVDIGSYTYTTLDTDDNTVYECGYEIISSNTIKVYLPDGTERTIENENISEYNGRYFIFEEYSSGQTSDTPTDDFSRPSIMAVYCKSVTGHAFRDDFTIYVNGIVPSVSPTGHVYTLFRNETLSDNTYVNANGTHDD